MHQPTLVIPTPVHICCPTDCGPIEITFFTAITFIILIIFYTAIYNKIRKRFRFAYIGYLIIGVICFFIWLHANLEVPGIFTQYLVGICNLKGKIL